MDKRGPATLTALAIASRRRTQVKRAPFTCSPDSSAAPSSRRIRLSRRWLPCELHAEPTLTSPRCRLLRIDDSSGESNDVPLAEMCLVMDVTLLLESRLPLLCEEVASSCRRLCARFLVKLSTGDVVPPASSRDVQLGPWAASESLFTVCPTALGDTDPWQLCRPDSICFAAVPALLCRCGESVDDWAALWILFSSSVVAPVSEFVRARAR